MTLEDLTELRSVQRANVYKQGIHVATLTRTPDGIKFEYLPSWIREGGASVASTLPVSNIPVIRLGGALPSYFSGLFPEGRRLGVLLRQVKTSADDELSLLLVIGADVVGDVQVLPEGGDPSKVQQHLEVNDFGEISFNQFLIDLGIRAERVGIPGVQDKISTALLNLPVAHQGSRFILKLNPSEFPFVVENEEFFLRAAKLSGLNVASANLVTDKDGIHGLLVTRFDRIPSGGDSEPKRLAMEDACQALGKPPADKYLITSEEAFKALTALCLAPIPAARIFISQLVFAYLTGNGDAHAKNFSVMQLQTGEWVPTPAYDLPSTYFYGDFTMAMTICGRNSNNIRGIEFVELGKHLGLPERAVRRVITEQCDHLDSWLPLVTALPFDPAKIAKLQKFARYRRDRLQH
ncbi:MAG: type II toxin-antitoxin system HipA family toxin [Ilumatobacteraceae bacterium]